MSCVSYSVVIPNHHSCRIGEVLDALRRQEGVDRGYEILVVGRDKYGLVRKHEAEDKRVRFVESERDLNPAEARNRGIKAARGNLIFFIDASSNSVELILGTPYIILEDRGESSKVFINNPNDTNTENSSILGET